MNKFITYRDNKMSIIKYESSQNLKYKCANA